MAALAEFRTFVPLSVAFIVVACAMVPSPPVCPATFDEARLGDFDTVDEDTFVATGTVARFVNSPDPDSRGYDIAIARHDGPGFVDGVVLVRVAERIAGIENGQPVLVLGERTDRRNLILRGACPALQPIEDAPPNSAKSMQPTAAHGARLS